MMGMGNQGPPGPPGQGGGAGGQDTQWQTDVFRSSLIRKLEEAIRESGSSSDRNAVDLERQVFQRANSKEEYLSFVARLILHVRQQAGGQGGQQQQQQQQQQVGGGGDMMGGGVMRQGGVMMQQQGGGPGGPIIMNQMQQQQQGGMNIQQQQQMMQQQRMMQIQQGRGGMMMQQRQPMPMSQLEQRLQQQQQQQQQQQPQGGQMMMQRGPGPMQTMTSQPMPMSHPYQGARAPPPNYISGPSPNMPTSSPLQPQGPSPIPSYQGPSPQQLQQPSPSMMSMNPSPSSAVNTPLAAPASQEDREYLEKVKSLEKYIEPLRNMIAKIGNENDQDRLTKMKKLLDILSNPGRRMPISTLQKCEDVLKRMALEPDRDPNSQGGKESTSSLNPLLESVIKIRQNNTTAHLNHSLSSTFLPPCQSFLGSPIGLPPLPPSPDVSDDEDDIPNVLQGEIARLEPRFKVWLSPGQPTGDTGCIQLVCQLDDKDLPTVPHINVTIPQDYPLSAPVYPSGDPDYLTTPFLERVDTAFSSRLMQLPPQHTLSQLLTAWELSVRAACSPTYNVNTSNGAAAVLSGL